MLHNKKLSLLTSFAEDSNAPFTVAPPDTWSWKPVVEVDRSDLGEASPTTEYSSKEREELFD